MLFCRQILQTWYISRRYWRRLYVGVGVSIVDRYSAASSSHHCPLSVKNVIEPATISAAFCLWVAKFICSGFCCVTSWWSYYDWDWSNVDTRSYWCFLLTSSVLLALWELPAAFMHIEYCMQEKIVTLNMRNRNVQNQILCKIVQSHNMPVWPSYISWRTSLWRSADLLQKHIISLTLEIFGSTMTHT